MFSHNSAYENAFSFSRFDVTHPLSTHSAHPFILEDKTWLTAEHYYQMSKFAGTPYGERIASAHSAEQAYKLGNVWWKRKRGDFVALRNTLMTRALYSKAIQHDEVAAALLETGDQMLLENSAYGHYWGIGRDQRGDNHLGKIWMDIRQKLKERESKTPS